MTNPAPTKVYPTPSLQFALLARQLLHQKQNIMEYKECRPEVALEEARTALIWHHRLDAIAKGSIMGLGAGGLLFSGWGLAALFTGAAFATIGVKVTRQAIERAQMVDDAYNIYKEMSPAEFTQYLRRAPQAG